MRWLLGEVGRFARLTALSLLVGVTLGLAIAQILALGPVERAIIGWLIGTALFCGVLWILVALIRSGGFR